MTYHSSLEEEITELKRKLVIATRQWDSWKSYSLELNERLQKYEPGSPMLLNKSEKGLT